MLPLLDFVVIGAYLALCVYIGIRVGGKATDAASYFSSKGNIPWWAISLSIVAAETSMLTVISIPVVAYKGSLVFLQIVAGYVIGRMLVAYFMLPHYFAGEQQTAYTFFKVRFGDRFRKTISSTFLLTRLFADGIRIFAAAIPIKIITGFDYPVSIAIMGVLSLIYSFYGGLKSVIWIDVLQLTVYVSGGLFIIAQIFFQTDLPVFQLLSENNKLTLIQLPTSLKDVFFSEYNLIGAVLGGMFLTLASHGTDQLIIQKLLACADLKQARKALIGSGIFVFAQFGLFLTVGLSLFAHHAGADITTLGLGNQDELLLDYISANVPVGVKGLIIAGLFAAAMSTVTGSLSALSSSTLFDLFPKLATRPDAMTWSRAAMVFWAFVFVLFATLFSIYFTSQDPIVIIALRIAGFTYGALLGAFVVGRYTKVDAFSAYVGFFATIIIMATVISISMFVTKSGLAFPWYTFIGCSIYVITALTTQAVRTKVKG